MNIKKITLLVGMALAVVALAAPAGASALTLKDAGKEVNEQFFEMKGTWAPKFLGGTMDCRFRIRYTINLQVVRVTEFEVETDTCLGEGLFDGCEVTDDSVNGLPWTVDVDATKLTITDFTQETTFGPEEGEECAIEAFNIHFPTLTAKPDDPKAIRRLSYTGKGKFTIKGTETEEGEGEEGEEIGESEEETESKGTYEIA